MKILSTVAERIVVSAISILLSTHCDDRNGQLTASKPVNAAEDSLWKAPDTSLIPTTGEGSLIRYGRELIVHTSRYLGPKGKVMQISNGMNCQNCHLDAGTRPWANDFAAVVSTYPKYRERSGSVETIEKRINDCMERSLNGKPLDNAAKEMRAMVAYISWLGKDVPKGKIPPGTGIKTLQYLKRAADPGKGQIIFKGKCQVCHGSNGEGRIDPQTGDYLFPPLWGSHSYNSGAGIYRLSRSAGYVKYNMPFGQAITTGQKLADEACWDVAAFINSQPRPAKDLSGDWPTIKNKPTDYPFGPYADTFTERRHKYGPFSNPAITRSIH